MCIKYTMIKRLSYLIWRLVGRGRKLHTDGQKSFQTDMKKKITKISYRTLVFQGEKLFSNIIDIFFMPERIHRSLSYKVMDDFDTEVLENIHLSI